MMCKATLLLDRPTLARMFRMDEYIELAEAAFRMHGAGRVSKPGLLHIDADGGEFHMKAGVIHGDEPMLAVKINARFPGDAHAVYAAERSGSGIRGAVLVFDATTGYPLALMDSTEITSMRTGAATAVAAKYMARPDSAVVTVCGTGVQARAQMRALKCVLPLERAYVWGRNLVAARQLADEFADELRIEAMPAARLVDALRTSDASVTCTPATKFFLRRGDVPAGMFIAAVGTDSPGKQELEPALLAASRLVVDVLDQCATVGELQHALRLGVLKQDDVHAELGEIVAGRRSGRMSRDEITIFDSTGTAFQDATVASAVYQRARALGAGMYFDLFAPKFQP